MTEIFSIDLIRLDGGTQSRAQIDQTTVDAYAESIRSDAVFPPVVVFYDGKEYWLADGFHRVQAYKQEGCVTIGADIRSGTRREAILYSVGANASHGLRRSNADKRRAVETLLRDEEWSKKSDRWIAEKCGVDHRFVGNARVTTGDGPQLQERTGQDGKTRKLPTKREPAPETPPVEPHPALARQRSAPPAEMPEEPELDFEDIEPEATIAESAMMPQEPAVATAPLTATIRDTLAAKGASTAQFERVATLSEEDRRKVAKLVAVEGLSVKRALLRVAPSAKFVALAEMYVETDDEEANELNYLRDKRAQ